MSDETEDTGATAVTRALNKLGAVAKGLSPIDATLAKMATDLAAGIGKLSADKRATLESALKRNRTAEFSEGDEVRVRQQFREIYKPAGPYTVVSSTVVGGDSSKRGGRTYLKVKHANGNVVTAPATCFEPA